MAEDGQRCVEIVIYGVPIPQGRPRFARRGNYVTTYDPETSKNYKQLVELWTTQKLKTISGFKPYEKAVCVDIDFYLPIPQSWSKTKRTEAAGGVIRPITKPDLDNLYKAVTDAMIGLVWTDDSIITDAHIRKRYSDRPRAEIRVQEVI